MTSRDLTVRRPRIAGFSDLVTVLSPNALSDRCSPVTMAFRGRLSGRYRVDRIESVGEHESGRCPGLFERRERHTRGDVSVGHECGLIRLVVLLLSTAAIRPI
jgi:hypothetical protein